MGDYGSNQNSYTGSKVIVTGLLASQLVASFAAVGQENEVWARQPKAAYETTESLSSYGTQGRFIVLSSVANVDYEFAGMVSDFYAHLLNRQQLLGKEFEKVLHENLVNLYETQ